MCASYSSFCCQSPGGVLLVDYYCVFRKFRQMERRLLAKGLRGMVHLAGVWPGIVSYLC